MTIDDLILELNAANPDWAIENATQQELITEIRRTKNGQESTLKHSVGYRMFAACRAMHCYQLRQENIH